MEIRKVLERKDGIKYLIIPKKADFKKGDFVEINKIGGQDGREGKDRKDNSSSRVTDTASKES